MLIYKYQGKNELHSVLCATQYNFLRFCHMFWLNTAPPTKCAHALYSCYMAIDHMQSRGYLITNRATHVINNHVHLALAIFSGKKNEVVRWCYVLLTARHDFRIYMNRQLLD